MNNIPAHIRPSHYDKDLSLRAGVYSLSDAIGKTDLFLFRICLSLLCNSKNNKTGQIGSQSHHPKVRPFHDHLILTQDKHSISNHRGTCYDAEVEKREQDEM